MKKILTSALLVAFVGVGVVGCGETAKTTKSTTIKTPETGTKTTTDEKKEEKKP